MTGSPWTPRAVLTKEQARTAGVAHPYRDEAFWLAQPVVEHDLADVVLTQDWLSMRAFLAHVCDDDPDYAWVLLAAGVPYLVEGHHRAMGRMLLHRRPRFHARTATQDPAPPARETPAAQNGIASPV